VIITIIGEDERAAYPPLEADKFELSQDGGWIIATRFARPPTGLSSGCQEQTHIVRIVPEVSSIIVTEE
jgi:hypothetical protein